MFPQLHTILHFRKNGSISKKKIKLITTTVVMEKVLLCQYVIIEIMPVVDHVISRKITIFRYQNLLANFWEISETVLLENSSNRQLGNSGASHRPFYWKTHPDQM